MSIPTLKTRAADDRPQNIRRAYRASVDDVSSSKRTVTSIITTDGLDHYGEVILAKGIDLSVFRSNPVVLFGHCHDSPIGKNLWIKRFNKEGRSGLLALTKFARNELAEEIFQLYAEGVLNGWSIGATVDWSQFSPPTPEEIKARPDWKKARGIYRKSTLLEYSAVTIPANPEALGNEMDDEGSMKSLSVDVRRSIAESPRWSDLLLAEDVTRSAGRAKGGPAAVARDVTPPELPPLVGRTFDQALDATRQAVRVMTGTDAARAAALAAIDKAKGKV